MGQRYFSAAHLPCQMLPHAPLEQNLLSQPSFKLPKDGRIFISKMETVPVPDADINRANTSKGMSYSYCDSFHIPLFHTNMYGEDVPASWNSEGQLYNIIEGYDTLKICADGVILQNRGTTFVGVR